MAGLLLHKYIKEPTIWLNNVPFTLSSSLAFVSYILTSSGAVVGLQLLTVNHLNISLVYFCWWKIIPFVVYTNSRPRKHVNFPKSVISNSPFNVALSSSISFSLLLVMHRSSTYKQVSNKLVFSWSSFT